MHQEKFVYAFEEGRADMKNVLGGKGANLAEMTNLGLPVPPGFTITTSACDIFLQTGNFPEGLIAQIEEHLVKLEGKTGKKLGDEQDPLLVSVRSGAPFSMPTMMDTMLNLGLNDKSVLGLIKQTGNDRFAYDSYRRFIQIFGKVALRIDGNLFANALKTMKAERGSKQDAGLSAQDLQDLIYIYKGIARTHGRHDFPQDPHEQLDLAIKAVFESWNKLARDYRKLYKISDALGTAVNVQTMVLGNKDDTSATSVAFTRIATTGKHIPYGDYLLDALGENVAAGIRRTQNIANIEIELPDAYRKLLTIFERIDIVTEVITRRIRRIVKNVRILLLSLSSVLLTFLLIWRYLRLFR